MKSFAVALLAAFLGVAGVAAQSRISQLPAASADAQLVLDFAQLNVDLMAASGPFLGPPLVARAFAIASTCAYDAWAAYDNRANPTFRNGIGRKTGSSTDVDTAIAYSVYRCLESIYSTRPDQLSALEDFFIARGFDPENTTTNTDTPAGVGNAAAATVLRFRTRDNSNQMGDEAGSVTGNPYSDFTNYAPSNSPQTIVATTDCSTVNVNKWQPLRTLVNGNEVTQTFAVPHAGTIVPFALSSAFEIVPRLSGPPLRNTDTDDEYVRQFTEVQVVQETLDDTGKMIAEFWADGPGTAAPPGHWHRIAIEAATLEQLGRGDAVKLLFAQSNAAFDAGLAAWAIKRYWDSARPLTAIQCLFAGRTIKGWRGNYQGVGNIDGNNWFPYQEDFFVTPPFAEYVSGHSSFSASSAEVLRRWFGDDNFRAVPSVTIPAGDGLFEPRITSGDRFVAGVTDRANTGPESIGYSPATDITLSWTTWTEAVNEAGFSRIFGGIHMEAGNEDGKTVGSIVGAQVWRKARKLWTGAARSRNINRVF